MVTLRTVPARTFQAADSSRRRILLIEDELTISPLIARALSAAGYVVDCDDTGTDGLKHAASGDYDLVLLDLVMPIWTAARSSSGCLSPVPSRRCWSCRAWRM